MPDARIRKADLEDQQGARDGKHAIAERSRRPVPSANATSCRPARSNLVFEWTAGPPSAAILLAGPRMP